MRYTPCCPEMDASCSRSGILSSGQKRKRCRAMSEPTISIVIAAWQDPAGLADCLEALLGQRDQGTEVLVVSTVAPPPDLVARFAWVVWLDAGEGLLTPELWSRGMAQACREVIALTTAHFTPASDWVSAIRRAHSRLEALAIGG